MNITHVMDSGGFYGKEHVVFELIKQQLSADHKVNLVILGDHVKAIDDQIRSLSKPLQYYWTSRMRTGFSIKDAKRLRDIIEISGCNIAHSHCTKSSIYMALLKPKTNIIRTIHGYVKNSIRGHIKYLIDRLALKRFDCVIGVSDNMNVFGVDNIIPNGISQPIPNLHNIDKATAQFVGLQEDWAVSQRPFKIIGCVARLSKEKNISSLIRAMPLLRDDCKLVVLGDGPEREYLENLVQTFELQDSVHFTGFVPNPTDYMSLFDIYTQPSFTEGLPISVLEALSLGRPCVLTIVGGMVNIVAENAALSCGTDLYSISDMIQFMLANPKRVKQISINARALFEKRFTSDVMAEQYQREYVTLMLNSL